MTAMTKILPVSSFDFVRFSVDIEHTTHSKNGFTEECFWKRRLG